MTKDYVWNSAICRCEDGKCLASIMNDSAIMCDESYIKKTKTTQTNIEFYILLAFLSITMTLLIAVSI